MEEKLGKYEIRGILGKGAMGTVYDARDPMIDRRVAIKTLTLPDAGDAEAQEELARFKREAQAAGRLAHPNIVGVFDYGETATIAYIVMEFVDGASLKTLLEKQERFPAAETVRIMEEMLAGLEFSHGRGVVHRDIKPANIMLTKSGQVKIADFGIARIESSSMTQAGTIMGTPAYMSPEQFMGQTVDARTDLYSAGVVLYQMLTGERPFEGSMTAIMHKALNTQPPRPSELSVTAPSSLDAVVARAMGKRPDARFTSAADFAASLRAAFAGKAELPPPAADPDATVIAAPAPRPRPAVAAPAASAARTPAAPRRNMAVLAAAGVAVVLAGGGAAYLLTRPTAPAATTLAVAPPIPAVIAPTTLLPTVEPRQPAPAASPPVSAPDYTPLMSPVQPTLPSATPPPTTQPPAVTPPAVAPTVVVPPTTRPPVIAAPTVPPPVAAPPPAATPAVVPPPTPPPVASANPVPVPPVVVPPAAGPPANPPIASPPAASPPAASPPAASLPAVTQPGLPTTSPVTPAPTPPPVQTAMVLPSPAAIRTALAAATRTAACSLVSTELTDRGTVAVSGLASRAAEPALRRAVASAAPNTGIDWSVGIFDGPYCQALDVIRPYARAGGRGDVQIGLKNNAVLLHNNESIVPRLTMPDFQAYLQIAYLASDRTMAHIQPSAEVKHIDLRLADGRTQSIKTGVAQDAMRSFPPLSVVTLGDPVTSGMKPADIGWTVAEPFGRDVLIVVASAAPLFTAPRPSGETPDAFLRDLQAAMEQARARGVTVTARALLLELLP